MEELTKDNTIPSYDGLKVVCPRCDANEDEQPEYMRDFKEQFLAAFILMDGCSRCGLNATVSIDWEDWE